MGQLRDKIRGMFNDQRTYYWIFAVVLVMPNLFLCFTEPLGLFAKIALILVPEAMYMLFLLVFRRPGIPMLIFSPMFIFGALQLVLLYLFGNSIVATDMFLTIASTNSNEAFELLDKLAPSLAGVIILYVPMIIFSIMSLRRSDRLLPSFRKRAAIVAGVVFLAGMIAMGIARKEDREYSGRLHVWPVNIFHNMYLAGEYLENTSRYHETSKDFTFNAISQHPDSIREVYIMVIGETARALNWQLYGYPRETTPLLSKTSNLVHFTDVLTQSNATYKSVPILLSPASAENYNDIFTQKSLITAYKEAGFRTVFLSNQMSNRSFVDFFAGEADTTCFLKEHMEGRTLKHEPFDSELLPMVDQLLAGGDQKLLIVLHTYGQHFNYTERYDAGGRYFGPDNFTSIKRKDRPLLINAYDNTVRSTDRFLTDIISRLSDMYAATAMLYISDHGEDILDDRRKLFLHASPIPSYYQLHVPLLMWFSDSYDDLWPEVRTNAQSHSELPVTSNVVFHTMLSLGGVETPIRQDSLTVVSPDFRVTTRHYLNDHNDPRTFDKIGLKHFDMVMIDSLGLDFPHH